MYHSPDPAEYISSPIFSNNAYLNPCDPSLLHPPVSPLSSETDMTTDDCSNSDCEDMTFRMDQLDSAKKLLRMFPPPMSANEFIIRNPFIGTDGHIKRPSNNFILFRKIAHDQKNQVQDLSNYNERQWSKIVGRIWKTLSVEEKNAYKKLGAQVAKLHHDMFPEYKYQPKRDKAAWKHFNPAENNSKKLKNKRKIKNRQQKQPTEIITNFESIPPQQQLLPPSPIDSTLDTLDYTAAAPEIPPVSATTDTEFSLFDESAVFNVNNFNSNFNNNFSNNFAFNVSDDLCNNPIEGSWGSEYCYPPTRIF